MTTTQKQIKTVEAVKVAAVNAKQEKAIVAKASAALKAWHGAEIGDGKRYGVKTVSKKVMAEALVDGAFSWMFGAWKTERLAVLAQLLSAVADMMCADYVGEWKTVRVRNLDLKSQVCTWRVQFSKDGKFYRREHCDENTENKVVLIHGLRRMLVDLSVN